MEIGVKKIMAGQKKPQQIIPITHSSKGIEHA